MKNFVGIDLGTTNSAICSYDGSENRIWKSPEQNDVTPSAIYIDRRGNKYVGKRAYDSAAHSPNNAATLFKRVMGTSTPIQLSAVNLTLTPEECSAEVLKVLFGYLPEEIRNDPDAGTVITVPAAFNQMQKDATMQAANMAGIGKVALMQEPVAAVMSVMQSRNSDGMFLIYDLGGGTLDIAIAESTAGRVNLLAHGGIAMCGGRDFDRALVDNIVRPWLLDNFDLPEDLSVNQTFTSLIRLATWATERAKIELSAREEVMISLSEVETRLRDLNGNEIYLDIPLHRDIYDQLIAERVNQTTDTARETLKEAGLMPHDLECIVWVGGPTHYKLLRDKVAFELGIDGNMAVDPMTAVAEGASLFAESIDWSSQNRSRKSVRGQISAGGEIDMAFKYIARTPSNRAKIVVDLTGQVAAGSEFQIDSADTGWTSGRLPLKHRATLDVTLAKSGDNTFKVTVFDSVGRAIAIEQDTIVVTRTAATVDGIPAAHSVRVEVLKNLGGKPVLDEEPLVQKGDRLPTGKRQMLFKAAESLDAGSSRSLNFRLWEGEFKEIIDANRFIGVVKITGSDFDEGVIPVGAELVCEYQMLDSGLLKIEISVPSIGATFRSDKNFNSPQEGEVDLTSGSVLQQVAEEGEQTLNRIDEIGAHVNDSRLEQARQKLESAAALNPAEAETEKVQEARDNILAANQLVARVETDKEHRKEIRQVKLNKVVIFFDEHIRQQAGTAESAAFDNLAETAQGSIDRNDDDFEHLLDELHGKNFEILWRQDWFVIEQFKQMVNAPHLFADKRRFDELAQVGVQLIQSYNRKVGSLPPEFAPIDALDSIQELRRVVAELGQIQTGGGFDNEVSDLIANIIRG